MVRKKTLISDAVLNELTFDTLFHLSQPDKVHLLTPPELRATKNARTAKQYASQMSLDEKIILFAKIGIPFFFGVGNTNWNLKKFFEKYKDLTKGQKLAEASKTKVVIVNDKIVADFLSVMANITHSETYLLNMDFHRVGHFVNQWKDSEPNADKIQESLEYAKIINQLILASNMAIKNIKGDLDLNILMYLYGSVYVSRGTIDNYFGAMYKKTVIAASLKRLIEKSLIERNPTVRLPEYQITSFGTTAVMSFHTKNLQAV